MRVDLCQSCGRGKPRYATVPDDVRPEVLHDGRITPVTPVTPKVVESDPIPAESGRTTIMRRDYDPLLVVGKPCPTCGKKVGRRTYRERKEGS